MCHPGFGSQGRRSEAPAWKVALWASSSLATPSGLAPRPPVSRDSTAGTCPAPYEDLYIATTSLPMKAYPLVLAWMLPWEQKYVSLHTSPTAAGTLPYGDTLSVT
jgi:hypothetical protein